MKTQKGTTLHILNLKGKDYLPVAQRLIWFREERPNWSIETEVRATNAECLAKATVKDDSGRVIATAHKTETKQGFMDFVEKSETGAIGRALALCGYGTQWTVDFEEGERIVDSPIERPQTNSGALPRSLEGQSVKPLERSTEPYNDDLASFRIGFGKYKGKQLKDIVRDDLEDYCNFLERSNSDGKGKLGPMACELLDKASRFLRTNPPIPQSNPEDVDMINAALSSASKPDLTDEDIPF